MKTNELTSIAHALAVIDGVYIFNGLAYSLSLSLLSKNTTARPVYLYDNQFFRLLRRCKIQYSEQEFINIVPFQPVYTQTHVIPEKKKKCPYTALCTIYVYTSSVLHAAG